MFIVFIYYLIFFFFFFFFFFQAEDGIRDVAVTGVQTCALPICGCACHFWRSQNAEDRPVSSRALVQMQLRSAFRRYRCVARRAAFSRRSEERRVGKECRSWGGADQ